MKCSKRCVAVIMLSVITSAIGCDDLEGRLKRAAAAALEDPDAVDTPEPHHAAAPPTEGLEEEWGRNDEGEAGQDVVIQDHGLGVARSTIRLPAGWTVVQDIATDPQTGSYQRYVFDRVGPEGELVRARPMAMFHPAMKTTFAGVWKKSALEAVAGVLDTPRIAALEPSPLIAGLPTVKEVARNQPVEALEAPITGSRDGEPYGGRVYVVKLSLPGDTRSGMVVVDVLVAPEKLVEQTIATYEAIARSERPNPQYRERMAIISQRNQRKSQQMMRDSQNAHQQRMRQNQAAFDAHQGRMRQQSQAFDASNQAWMNNFRGDGPSGGEGYTGHDAFIDTIREENTFADPSTGNNVQMQQRKYNYTDGQGNFFGTDDPSFEPSQLQGDWRETDPLSP